MTPRPFAGAALAQRDLVDQAKQFRVAGWVVREKRVILRQSSNSQSAHAPFAAILQGEQLRIVVEHAAGLANEIANLGERSLGGAFGRQRRNLGEGYSGHRSRKGCDTLYIGIFGNEFSYESRAFPSRIFGVRLH